MIDALLLFFGGQRAPNKNPTLVQDTKVGFELIIIIKNYYFPPPIF